MTSTGSRTGSSTGARTGMTTGMSSAAERLVRSASGKRVTAGVVATIIALVVVPMVASAYQVAVLTSCAIYSIAAAAVGMLYGRVGIVSIMQIGLVAVGGWWTLRFYWWWHLPFEVNMVLAAVVTMIIGTVLSLPALRLSGLNLAIVTLMIAGALQTVIAATAFPQGGPGLLGQSSETGVMSRPSLAPTDDALFRYVVVVALILYLALVVLLMNRPGRVWAAMRQSEANAIAVGINTTKYRIVALAVASLITGFAGALAATPSGSLGQYFFTAPNSVLLFATVLIGGAYSLLGAVLAGFLFQGVPSLLNQWFSNVFTQATFSGFDVVFVILGLGLIQAITTNPRGIAGQLGDLWSLIWRKLLSRGAKR